MMNIYVGNLSYDVDEEALTELFTPFGSVSSVKVVTDRATGKSKGFAFVEMESREEGENAISNLDGTTFSGRRIVVNPARPKSQGGGGGGGGGGGNRRPSQGRPRFQGGGGYNR